MVKWPRPKSVKALRGFLCLFGYYRKYVANYGHIYKPLIDLVKTNSFYWNTTTETAFEQLKLTMTSTLVLALPDYDQTYVVETNASNTHIGVVLMQNGRTTAFFSKVLSTRHWGKSIYENEYIALLNVIDRWRHYLHYKHFIVWTNHYSLKYLLEQKVTSAIKQKVLTKLLGLDFEVQFKKGTENRVANALLREFEDLIVHKKPELLSMFCGKCDYSYLFKGDST